jgi:hypothetical protein
MNSCKNTGLTPIATAALCLAHVLQAASGILCDPKHPALDGFPTDFHSNWQWWEIQHQARPFIPTKHQVLKPTAHLIDDWFTHRRLRYVFEARVGKGHLLATSLNLHQAGPDKPAAAALLRSLV